MPSEYVTISRETAETATRVLLTFTDDEAIMRGCNAVRRMHVLRIGDMHDHAEAFRKAFLSREDNDA